MAYPLKAAALCVLIAAVVGCQATATPTVTVTKTVTANPSAAGKPGAKAQAAAKPVTVLTEKGNGIKSTKSFTVQGDWDLAYAYDCASFGGQGNFSVSVAGSAGDVLVNELGTKGKDITHQHDGPGKIALEINSECAWSLRVDQLP